MSLPSLRDARLKYFVRIFDKLPQHGGRLIFQVVLKIRLSWYGGDICVSFVPFTVVILATNEQLFKFHVRLFRPDVRCA
jgi:hypothetical protein